MKYQNVTIQMEATEQYFRVVMCIMFYKMVLTFVSGDDIQKGNHSNKSYCAVLFWALFIILYKVVVTCESVNEILKCDHSNESY